MPVAGLALELPAFLRVGNKTTDPSIALATAPPITFSAWRRVTEPSGRELLESAVAAFGTKAGKATSSGAACSTTSQIETTGKSLAKIEMINANSANPPARMDHSTQLGE